MRTLVGLFATLALALAGCGGRTLYHGGDVPIVPGNFVYNILPAAGIAGVVPGQDVGYYITANTGGSFRLVWTGDVGDSGARRHFMGSVWTTGQFTSKLDGCAGLFCALEGDDRISIVHDTGGGQRVDWDTFATDGLDGFDFIVTEVPVYFDLRIEGQQVPDLTYFPATDNGGAVSNAGAMPFGLIPQ